MIDYQIKDFKSHLDKLVKDFHQQLELELSLKESLEEQRRIHQETMQRLDHFLARLDEDRRLPADPFFTNDEFVKLLKISSNTALNWRNKGLVNFSMVGGMIYYRMSDIQKMLDDNYQQSKDNLVQK